MDIEIKRSELRVTNTKVRQDKRYASTVVPVWFGWVWYINGWHVETGSVQTRTLAQLL